MDKQKLSSLENWNNHSTNSMDLLYTTQQQISDSIKDFLRHPELGTSFIMEYLEVIKQDRKNSTTSYSISSEIGRNLMNIEHALLIQANKDNNLQIPEENLNFHTLKLFLQNISKKDQSSVSVWENISPEIEFIDDIILPPDEIKPQTGFANWNRNPEQHTREFDKYSLVLQILKENPHIQLIDRPLQGKVDPRSMRKKSYIVFKLTTPYPKTLYINNLYGQASYITEGHLTKEELTTYKKSDHRAVNHPRVKFFSYKDPLELNPQGLTDRKTVILNYLTQENRPETQEDMSREKNKESKTKKEKTNSLKRIKLTSEIARELVINKYGNNEGNIPNPQQALEYLLFKGTEWRMTSFKISHDNKDIGTLALHTIFNIRREKRNDLYKDDAWYELLGKVFDKTVEQISELVRNICKTLIIKTYWTVDNTPDPQQALEYLLFKGTEWRRTSFKISHDNKDIGIIALHTIFNIRRERKNDLYKDDAWYELLGKVFNLTQEELNTKIKYLEEKEKNRLQNTYKELLIKTYWTVDNTPDPQQALEYLLFKGTEWRMTSFKISHDNKDIGTLALHTIFNIRREKRNDLYKDDAWYELLGKVFDKTVEQLEAMRKRNWFK
jgi:hypothetical protein